MGSDDPTQAKRVWGHPEGARPKGVSDTIKYYHGRHRAPIKIGDYNGRYECCLYNGGGFDKSNPYMKIGRCP